VEVNSRTYRTNPIIAFLSGLVIIILSILVYLLVIRNVYGRFNSAELLPDLNVLKNLLLGSQPEVAILNSVYTANILSEKSNWQKDNIDTWKKFISAIDLKYEIISDDKLERGECSGYKLIVIPGSKSLSDKEIIEIKKYLKEGGSIFATGGTASFSDDGKWRGWQFISDVFGINFTREIGNDERSKIHTLRGGLPITANVPTGFPLRVATWDKPVAVEVLDPRTTQVSFWYNYRFDEGLVREGIKKSTGIVYGTYGKGRFVWMGFEINSIIGIKDDYVIFDRIFKNCVNWLTYSPIAYIRDWPTGFNSAAVLVTEINKSTENVDNLLEVLKKKNVKSTFFIRSSIAEQNNKLIKSLKGYGEIASLYDNQFGEENLTKSGNEKSTLVEKLNFERKKFSDITHKNIYGILPVSNGVNQSLIYPAMDAGYEYILLDSLTDRSVPKIFSKNNKKIVLITKTARDDYEIIRDNGLTKPEFQFYSYQEDIDRILFEGGLYVFKMHPEYQCTLENISVVAKVIDDLKYKGLWITTLGNLEKWYSQKENVELRTKKLGKSRVAVTISNQGNAAVSDLKIDVDLNENAFRISLESEIIGTKKVIYQHKEGSKFVFLLIDDLEAGESRTYYIDYDIFS